MSTKGPYSLIAIYAKVAGISILIIVKANSKNLIIKDMFDILIFMLRITEFQRL
jgi:hypothetical protein